MAREMKDSGIENLGNIPANWDVCRFKNVCEINTEFVDPQSGEYNDLPHIGPGNIEKFTGRLLEYKLVSEEGLISGKYHFYPYEIVYGKINPQLGKVAFPEFEGLCSADAYAIHTISKIMHIKYLYYYMLTRPFIDSTILESLRMGMPKINSEDLMKLKIIRPNIEEQKRIVEFLDSECPKIDIAIDQTRTSIEEYKKLKQAVITQAVTKGIRPDRQMKDSGIEWIGMIPIEWNCTTIGRIATVVRGGSPRPAGDPRYFNGSFMPWITVAEVTNSIGKYITSTATFLTEEGAKRSRVIEENTLLLSNSGATLGVPKITMIKGCINDGSVAFYDVQVDIDYLLYLFEARTLELRKQMQGSGQPNLNTTIIKSLYVPVPTKDEQIEIAMYLDLKCRDIEQLIEKKEQLIHALESYKKSLIYEYVTGKKEVPA